MPDQFIQDIARKAGKITLDFFRKSEVQYAKAHSQDVVTQADLASNEFIANEIKKNFPNDGVISEEQEEYNLTAENIWIVDPLDGTLNFSKGIPIYCILIARAKAGKVNLAVIYDPIHDEMLFAKRGEGAYVNGQKISCSMGNSLEDTAGCVNSGYGKNKFEQLNKMIMSTPKNKIYVMSLFSLGMSAVQVATGRRDWYMTTGGSLWDHAAPSLILEESGCKVTNIKGEPWTFSDETMLAANPVLHEKILTIIK